MPVIQDSIFLSESLPLLAITIPQALINITKRAPFLLALLAIAICVRSFVFYLSAANILVDFDVFYLAGELFWQGRLSDAHYFSRFVKLQLESTGVSSLMPWSYPAQFTLVLAPFVYLPKPLAYLAFIALSFSAYLCSLKRLAGRCFGVTLLASYATLLVNISCGQNGALSAALLAIVCSACVLTPSRPLLAGVTLGLLVIKPHLAFGVTALLVFLGRWSILAVAAVVASISVILVSAILGFSYWGDLFNSFREARHLLSEGAYPLYRMVSVYALFRSFGVSADYSFTMQGLSGTLALVVLFIIVKRGGSLRLCFASGVVATLFISPYLYDYDLAALGVSLALILPEVINLNEVRGNSLKLLALLVIFSALAGYSGVLLQDLCNLLDNYSLTSEAQQRSAKSLAMIIASDIESLKVTGVASPIPSLGAVFILGVVCILRSLARASEGAAAVTTKIEP